MLGVGVERGHERRAVPEVHAVPRRVGGEGRLLQSGWEKREGVRSRRGAVRRRGLVEHDAVTADREARLPEAHPEAARAAERHQPDLSARLRRHARRLRHRRHGGRCAPVGDYEDEVIVVFVVMTDDYGEEVFDMMNGEGVCCDD